jgi:hypothetical protein
VQQNIFGLDVAVDHAVAVRVVDRTRHLARDAHRIDDRELALTVEARPQRLAGNERHCIVEQSVGIAAVEERKNVRML